jgi:hypothetical protein
MIYLSMTLEELSELYYIWNQPPKASTMYVDIEINAY